MIARFCRAGLLMVASAFGALCVRPGDFRVIGPGGGGAMFHPTISPHDPNTVFVACDMTGAYITHDAGRSWRMFNLRGAVHFFVFDPLDAKAIYAGTTGLWRSEDSGESWRLVYPKPSSIRGVRMNSDHADEEIVAEPDPLGRITAMAVDPVNSRELYVAARHNQSAELFVSHDRGTSWEPIAALPEPAVRIWIDPATKLGARRVFAAGKHGFFAVGAKTVQAFRLPEPELLDASAGFDVAGPAVLYAISAKRAFVSRDRGRSWQECAAPGQGGNFLAIATSLNHPQTAYLSFSEREINGTPSLGVARTQDAGEHWRLVWKETTTTPDPRVHDAWITPALGPDWAGAPFSLGVADQNPEICYGTDYGRTMQTVDGGRNWSAVYSRAIGAGWATTGLDVTTSYGIHFDPFDRNRQFITYTDIGLFRSEDGGRSWQRSMTGVPREWWNTTYWLVFDPAVKGRIWSVNSYTHDLPRPKMWRHQSPENYRGGVCRSDDGGRTWAKSSDGMPKTAATHIILDPSSPVHSRTLYVAAFGRGVFKSTDGGRSWKLKNNGIVQQQPFAWRLTRAANGALYVVIARRTPDGSTEQSGEGALYRSDDGAERWRPVPLPDGVTGPNGLAVDSRGRLYLAAWARPVGTHGEGGGVYVSDNEGQSWRQVLARDQHVYDVTLDPRNSNIVYAAGFESSAWRSADRGEHWTRVPGFNFKWGHRVIPDPADTSKVYVTTFGGSVWHGSVNGKPAILDIATPEMHY